MSEFVLEVYEGVGQVRRVPLGEAPIRIGRTQDCDVVVTGPGVSRLHCVIERVDGAVHITNHSTTKAGTRVNGDRVDGGLLKAGDEITVGPTVMVFTGAAAPAEPKPKPDLADSARSKKGDSARSKQGDSARSGAAGDSPPGAPAAVEEDASGEVEGADEPAGGARDSVQEFLARRELEKKVKTAVGLVALTIASALGAWGAVKVFRGMDDGGVAKTGAKTGATPGGKGGPGEVRIVSAADPRAWNDIHHLPPAKIPTALEAYAEAHPEDPRADDAVFFAKRLRDAQSTAGAHGVRSVVEAMYAEALGHKKNREPAEANRIFKLVAALSPGTPLARKARQEQRALRATAREAFEDLRDRARAMASRIGPVQSLIMVADARTGLRGLGHDDDLDALVAELEEQAAKRQGPRVDTVRRSGQAYQVEQDALALALRFDWPKAWDTINGLLLLGLDEEQRYRAHWLRARMRELNDLYDAMLAAAKGPKESRPTLTMRGNLKLRLVSATHKKVVLEPAVAQGSGEIKRPWSRLTPWQVQELFRNVAVTDYRLVKAKAFHAFKTGLEDRGVELLYLYAGHKRKQAEIFSLYSLATGIGLPEGGFVQYKGRLVSPKQRDEALAAKAAARAAAKELAQAGKEERSRKKLLSWLKKTLDFMDQGHYKAGRQALGYLAKKHADVPGVGDVALARLNSPLLRRRDYRKSLNLGVNGPSAKRLDIYFMGDGFLVNDSKQKSFDRFADSAIKFCRLQDFFKEYDAYINYWAVNLESKEEGLTKDGQAKDTALGTAINGGVHTVADRGKVFSLLEKHFPNEHDRLAICLGNDFANVATGGGGTVAVCKTMLSATPHEIGHAFGGLGDEYEQEPGPNPGPPQNYTGPARAMRANIVMGGSKAGLAEVASWKAWLDPTGDKNWTKKPIDFFEGANRQKKGYWRPQKDCVMRNIGSGFCAPCMEVMVLRLYDYVRPIDEHWPKEASVTAGRKALTFRVLVMKPATHPLFVHWRRKTLALGAGAEVEPDPEPDEPEGDGTRVRKKTPKELDTPAVKDISGRLQVIQDKFYVHYIKIRPRELKPGTYEISAEVWDPTPWIRDEHRQKLTQTQTWTLKVPER